MKIITAVGYYGTGSSAVVDLLKEYDNCSLVGKGDYEIRFVQDPDGISDLYHNIVENNHRHNTSNSIKRFKRYAKYLNGDFYSKRYKKIFGNNFKKYTDEYINKLTQLKTKTWWHIDQINKGRFLNFIDICFGLIAKKIVHAQESVSLFCNNEWAYYTYLTDEEFCTITRDYLEKLFSSVANKPNIVVEQIVPPSNVDRYLKFFNDLKVIVVDRDPRDLYILSKAIYKTKIIPVENVEEFCKWFKITREHRKHETNRSCLLVKFEDMIYKYEQTVELIEQYTGVNKEEHTNFYKYFDPKISIKGTKLFEKYEEYANDIHYIENELGEYLYNYGE